MNYDSQKTADRLKAFIDFFNAYGEKECLMMCYDMLNLIKRKNVPLASKNIDFPSTVQRTTKQMPSYYVNSANKMR